jgi:hypothetical protein
VSSVARTFGLEVLIPVRHGHRLHSRFSVFCSYMLVEAFEWVDLPPKFSVKRLRIRVFRIYSKIDLNTLHCQKKD